MVSWYSIKIVHPHAHSQLLLVGNKKAKPILGQNPLKRRDSPFFCTNTKSGFPSLLKSLIDEPRACPKTSMPVFTDPAYLNDPFPSPNNQIPWPLSLRVTSRLSGNLF